MPRVKDASWLKFFVVEEECEVLVSEQKEVTEYEGDDENEHTWYTDEETEELHEGETFAVESHNDGLYYWQNMKTGESFTSIESPDECYLREAQLNCQSISQAVRAYELRKEFYGTIKKRPHKTMVKQNLKVFEKELVAV